MATTTETKANAILGTLPVEPEKKLGTDPRQQVAVKVQQQAGGEPFKILQGMPPRNDGYQVREEYGLALNDAQYEAAQEQQGIYQKNAEDYRTTATSALNSEIRDAQGELNRAKPKDPGKPAETIVWAGGDGDKPQKYVFPTSAMPAVIQAMEDTDYYTIKQHDDGSYGIAFKEYGREGYLALNEAEAAYQGQLRAQREEYNSALRDWNNYQRALNTTAQGGRELISSNYANLSGLFGREMGELAKEWQEKKGNNSASIQQLVDSGVLRRKAGVVG